MDSHKFYFPRKYGHTASKSTKNHQNRFRELGDTVQRSFAFFLPKKRQECDTAGNSNFKGVKIEVELTGTF